MSLALSPLSRIKRYPAAKLATVMPIPTGPLSKPKSRVPIPTLAAPAAADLA